MAPVSELMRAEHFSLCTPCLSREGQKALDDSWCESSGLPLDFLMEGAAAAVFHFLAQQRRKAKSFLLLAGSGQNGGDAWALARQLLSLSAEVLVLDFAWERPDEGAAGRMRAAAKKMGVRSAAIRSAEDLPTKGNWDILIEGLLGSGFRPERPLKPLYAAAFAWAEARSREGRELISLDLPGGISASTGEAAPEAVHADLSLSFDRAKAGLLISPGREHSRETIVLPIGIPLDSPARAVAERELRIAGKDFLRAALPLRPDDGNKGLFGRGLLLAGSETMPGGLCLAAEAALAMGPGYLELALDPGLRSLCLTRFPEALYPDFGQLEERAALASLSAAGPAWGRGAERLHLLKILLEKAPRLLLDADALNLLAEDADWLTQLKKRAERFGEGATLLTPHPGEFGRLFPQWRGKVKTQRLKALKAALQLCPCLILLKGANSLLGLPDGRVLVIPVASSALAKAGSGDVLSGLILGLGTQMEELAEAALAGALLHGYAGLALAEAKGEAGVRVSELAEKALSLRRDMERRQNFSFLTGAAGFLPLR